MTQGVGGTDLEASDSSQGCGSDSDGFSTDVCDRARDRARGAEQLQMWDTDCSTDVKYGCQ